MKPDKPRGAARRHMAAPLLRLARRLGKTPEEMAETIPADTLRRLQYPVRERRLPDGKLVYEHDLGIEEGVLSKPLR